MDGVYDEIIAENPFFVELKTEFSNLFQHSISEAWIICVPRIGSLNTRVFTIEDFCAHILVPSDELPETHFNTLTEKQVTITNKVITLELAKGLPLQSHILFEETFYTEDFIKYKVWCIETPLEHSVGTYDNFVVKEYLTCINDCIDLLWTQAAGRQVLDHIESKVQLFLKKHPILPVALSPLQAMISELYTECLQVALQNRRLREKSKLCKQIMENIKIAVECYMQHLLFDSVFKSICTCCAYEDSHLNKKIRNMSDIQLRDLDIRKDLYHSVPQAKQILSKIDSYNTVLEKVLCLKQALNAISKKNDDSNITLLTADDLLPVFVFLVIKSGLPTWYSQLIYMKEFRFNCVGKGDGDEIAFLITTLEAVVEHIQSGALTGPPDPEAYYYDVNLTENNVKVELERKNSYTESMGTSESNTEETLEYIFDLIKANHCEQVQAILHRNQKHLSSVQEDENSILNMNFNENDDDDDEDDNDETAGEIYHKLCHPLCNCKKCCHKISKRLLKSSPTVASRDNHGLTALHMAAIYGKSTIVEALIDLGADVNVADVNESTPLHYAASRGHQNALLLIVHSGANINQPNIDKNTPLHFCVNNGHLNCVKALVYFAEHSRKKLNINIANENGNTALHLASKWGYEGIAKLLIESGAEPSLQNHHNKTAFDYAHNLRILHVLKSSLPNLYEYIHITHSDIKPLYCEAEKSETVTKQKPSNKKLSINRVSKTVEDLKIIERVLKAISYGDVKLACFYMNINYPNDLDTKSILNKTTCHPLCECQNCQKSNGLYETDFNVDFCDLNGYTALHYAASFGLDELCHILIINKANVNPINKRGQTPLHLAANNNKTVTIRLLLDNNANINAVDMAGNTPLHYASQMGNIGAVKIFIRYRPDTTILNSFEKSALDIAKEKVHLTIIDIIEKYQV